MKIKSIKQIKDLQGVRVLVRVDFNVPLKNGRVLDDYKIVKSIPNIKYLLSQGAAVILMSHLGRPKKFDSKLSLKPIKTRLEKLLGKKVKFFDLKKFEEARKESNKLKPGELALIENIRFYPGEEKNDVNFIKQLASLGDVFVLDGFAVAHRSSSSVSGLSKYLPAYAGILLNEEISGLSKILKPKKPFVVIIGGAKIGTKLPLIKKFLPKAKYILVGGGISNTCLWAQGIKVGSSLVDKEMAKEAMRYAKKRKLIFPVDYVVGEINGKNVEVVKANELNIKDKKKAIYDIGPETVRFYSHLIKRARTLVWNGAMGYFEQPVYRHGTYSIARLFVARSKGIAFGVTGGGETEEVIKNLELDKYVDLVSTGGGALLEFLSGKKLPGIEALKKSKKFKRKK